MAVTAERAPFGLPFPAIRVATKVLIVEDHSDGRKMLSFALRKLGFEVLGTDNAAAALHAVREHKPAIVMLDISLSDGQNGLQVCEKIKAAKASQTPYVIITSGHSDRATVAEARRLGADAYLVKPFRLSRLLEIVSEADQEAKGFIVEMHP